MATGWEADGGSGRLDSMFAVVVVALVAMARVCLFTSRHQSRLKAVCGGGELVVVVGSPVTTWASAPS